MIRRLKKHAKRAIFRGFTLGQRVGFDFLPRHFYSEIPSIDKMRRSHHWRQPFSMTGVSGRECDEQLAFVRSTCPPELTSRLPDRRVHHHACVCNGEIGFGEIEADFLYCFVASRRPQRIVQIGCGVSTAVCLFGAQQAGYCPELICIEPYPNAFLRQAQQDGKIRLIEKKVEELDISIVQDFAGGDLLFVDSTHTLGPAGEVTRIVLELLPALPAGAWVHFHDILFPYDYPRQTLSGELFFGHETALLLAFLTYNRRFSIAGSLSMLHYACRGELKQYMPNYRPAENEDGLEKSPGHFPSSTYLAVTD